MTPARRLILVLAGVLIAGASVAAAAQLLDGGTDAAAAADEPQTPPPPFPEAPPNSPAEGASVTSVPQEPEEPQPGGLEVEGLEEPKLEEPESTGPPTFTVEPGDDLAALAASAPEGSTFVIARGLHRPDTVVPRPNQTFLGEEGAVLSGAVELAAFRQEGSLWVVEGVSAEGRRHGQCESSVSRCDRPEALYLDNELLRHVSSRSDVGPGTWYLDYGRDRVWMGDDPAGRRVELSVTPAAFTGAAPGVTIAGLTIERFAAPAQEGAIDSRRDTSDLVGGRAWVIADNVVRWNSGIGVSATTDGLVSRNLIYENGQMGVSAHGSGVTFRNNEIWANNTARFDQTWEAGGAKFTYTSNLLVEGNYVHNNGGVGLWTDIDNINTVYRDNRVVDNERAGIFHEISYDALITDNDVSGNGFGYEAWLWGGGIVVATSSNVEISGNTVTGNADGITGIHQRRPDAPASYGEIGLTNLSVHDNLVAENGGVTGIAQDVGSDAVYIDANNRFFANTFSDDNPLFYWFNRERSRSEWEAFGQS